MSAFGSKKYSILHTISGIIAKFLIFNQTIMFPYLPGRIRSQMDSKFKIKRQFGQ